MVTPQQIEQLGRDIAEKFRPERIILFGSQARGEARMDSDVDLLLIMPCSGSQLGQAAAVARTIRAPFDVDVLVRTPEEVRQRLEWGDRFMRAILQEGRTLYEAPDG